ncbi:MAG: amino acid ABC transporter permease, partial [Acidimicrobiia bacterium]|nr:amino acid ABC transporter permease [Acidimicrobiia bacterium]
GGFLIIVGLTALTISGVVFGSGTSSLKPVHVIIALVLGAAFAAGGYFLLNRQDAKTSEISLPGIFGFMALLAVVALYVVRLPSPARLGADQIIEWQPISDTTQIPWTIVIAAGIVGYLVTAIARRSLESTMLRRLTIGLWIVSYPVIVLVILRDPEINYDRVWRIWDSAAYNEAPAEGFGAIGILNYIGWVPVAVLFAVLGGLLLRWATYPSRGEEGWIVGGVLLVLSLVIFFIPMSFQVRILLLTLAAMTLGAKTFGGEGSARTRYIGLWVLSVAIITYLIILIATKSTVEVDGPSYLGGFILTFVLAFTSIAMSFPLGVILALGRTSTMPLFRLVSTAYIEIIRGVPLITWLIFGAIMLPVFLPQGVELQGIVRAMFAIAFFSAAYLAENVRGGLQSIPNGQYEAAKALGMGTVQMTVFITLPQALRAVIPALVGQVIALFKDTSLVTIIGIFDFLHIARAVIPAQSNPFNFQGTIRETLLFAALFYWIFTFAFSRASIRLEKKLGVGER